MENIWYMINEKWIIIEYKTHLNQFNQDWEKDTQIQLPINQLPAGEGEIGKLQGRKAVNGFAWGRGQALAWAVQGVGREVDYCATESCNAAGRGWRWGHRRLGAWAAESNTLNRLKQHGAPLSEQSQVMDASTPLPLKPSLQSGAPQPGKTPDKETTSCVTA